jgi:putative ABC transport system permease protein
VVPLIQQVTENVRMALGTLLGAVGLVLLIACANVANLLLSRASARRKEMALRAALGASRRRLGRQLLTESVLLATIGGSMGLALASAAIRIFVPYLPADVPRVSGITVDPRVLLFTGALSLTTGILFGLAPLFQLRRADANEALKQSARIAGGVQSRMLSGLAVGQVAIAVVLLIGAGLMARSFWTLVHVSPGYRTERVLTARLSSGDSSAPPGGIGDRRGRPDRSSCDHGAARFRVAGPAAVPNHSAGPLLHSGSSSLLSESTG